MRNRRIEIRTVIIVGVLAALVLAYFLYLNFRPSDDEQQLSELQQVISRDLTLSYPTTPREVILFYDRILFSLFNDSYTEREQTSLIEQAKGLMDEEFLRQNQGNAFFVRMVTEVDDFRANERRITSSEISGTNEVVYRTVNGEELAYVDSRYFVRGGGELVRIDQTYVLRQEEESGRWKILGFYNNQGQGE